MQIGVVTGDIMQWVVFGSDVIHKVRQVLEPTLWQLCLSIGQMTMKSGRTTLEILSFLCQNLKRSYDSGHIFKYSLYARKVYASTQHDKS